MVQQIADADEADGHVQNPNPSPLGLVVGNYCHDVLFRDSEPMAKSLGGAASFISNVLDPFFLPIPSLSLHFVSKAGSDFAYPSLVLRHPPILCPSSPTTLFHAHLCSADAGARTLRRVSACDPIAPSEIPDYRFHFGVAAAVGGEISPETLSKMSDLCRVLLVDAQGLIRKFDPEDGSVALVPLAETEFAPLLPRVSFLKASAEEAPFLDLAEARKACCVIVTDGGEGCRVWWRDGEAKVAPFPATEVDPTGAGDSFLGGFVVGLASGLAVPDAALLGNFFGSLTVGQIGIPKFDPTMLQNVKKELERRTRHAAPCWRNTAVNFQKSDMHEEFHAFLSEAAKHHMYCSTNHIDDQDNNIHK